MNPFREVNWIPDKREKRIFARSLVLGFPALATFFSLIVWLSSHTWQPFLIWLALVGAALGAILWSLPSLARPFYVVWYFIACCFGFVIGNALLIAFYYVIITPIGLGLRAMGKLSLQKGFARSVATYWRDAEKTVDLKRYYRQF